MQPNDSTDMRAYILREGLLSRDHHPAISRIPTNQFSTLDNTKCRLKRVQVTQNQSCFHADTSLSNHSFNKHSEGISYVPSRPGSGDPEMGKTQSLPQKDFQAIRERRFIPKWVHYKVNWEMCHKRDINKMLCAHRGGREGSGKPS